MEPMTDEQVDKILTDLGLLHTKQSAKVTGWTLSNEESTS